MLMTTLQSLSLQPLPSIEAPALRDAVRHLVGQKYLLDQIADGRIALPGTLSTGGYGPHEPICFFSLLFPFVPTWNRIGEKFPALVPTAQTFGCSWRWRGRHLSSEERAITLEKVIGPENATRAHRERAEYFWIRPLGLVLPHEGKNRVDFVREMYGELIPALVATYDYPSADRMKYFRVQVNGRLEYWAVLDERWVQRMGHPEWVVPVLEAYGVIEGSGWPDAYCDVAEVALSFGTPSQNPDFLGEEMVDLEAVKAKRDHLSEVVPCAVVDIKSFDIAPKVWIFCIASCLICMGGLLLLPASWGNALLLAGIGAGASGGALFAYHWRGHFAKRSMLEDR